MTKHCKPCDRELPLSDFYKDRSTSSGLRSYCKQCDTKRVMERKRRLQNTPEWQEERRRAYFSSKYGLSPEAHQLLLDEFSHKCGICSSEVKLCVDHDHITNEVRGILCDRCNVGLGRFNDSIELLTNAISYLSQREVMTYQN